MNKEIDVTISCTVKNGDTENGMINSVSITGKGSHEDVMIGASAIVQSIAQNVAKSSGLPIEIVTTEVLERIKEYVMQTEETKEETADVED